MSFETLFPIGIVGGSGWLGGGIARSMLKAGFCAPGQLWISNRDGRCDGFEDWPEVTVTADNRALIEACGTVVLSVLPQHFAAAGLAIGDRLTVSVMAGVTAARIAELTGAARVVRSMPNAGVTEALSYTPWMATGPLSETDRAFVQAMFESCGAADEIADEDQLDYFTALTGSGPAFPALLAAAMIEDAVARGVPEAVATKAVRQVMLGAGHLIAEGDETPADTVKVFVDYAGTTAAGLLGMRDAGLAQAVAAGLEAGYARAKGGLGG